MTKIMMILLAGAVFAVSQMAVADDFMPRKLKITGNETAYATSVLQGNPVRIPVSVSGGDATIYLAVFTKDRARFIQNIETVSLSWRYVNQIDTCIYVSPPYHLSEGEHVIEWDGGTPDGTPLSAGEYYYYLWGIDTDSEKQLVSSDIPFPKTGGIIQTHDYWGTPLAHPFFYPNTDVYVTGSDSVQITRSRWSIGADPLDTSAIEQTWYLCAPNWAERGPLSISPYVLDQFYVTGYDLLENYGSTRRFHWVTDGVAVWDESWGTDDGEVRYPSVYPGQLQRDPGAVYIGSEDFLSATYIGTGESFITSLTAIDGIDGYIHYTIEPQSWWVAPNSPESQPPVESMSFREVHGMQSLIIGNHLGSMFTVINPQDNDGDWLRYGTELPPTHFPARGIPAIDQHGLTLLPGIGEDAATGALTPDGKWMGLLPFPDADGPLYTAIPVEYESPYDGHYFDASHAGEEGRGLWYRGYSTFRGLLDTAGIDINQPVDITAPNGGEMIPAGSIYTIRATHYNFSGSNKEVLLKYSLDGGISWALIDSISSPPSGYILYDWKVPNVIADECKIRIETFIDIYWGPGYRGDESNYPFSIVGPLDTAESQPQAFTIFPASPNPFNPSTAIEFILPGESPVTVTIYNTLGQRVERLHDGVLGAGRHRMVWDASDFGPGLYFYRVETDAGTKTGKMMLVK